MGSCLSSESRSPTPGSPLGLGVGGTKRKGGSRSSRRMGSRNSSFDSVNSYRREQQQQQQQLHRIPGRMFLNGSSDTASLFTQQGKKGTNQDAMLVWENFGSRTDTIFCGVFDGHGPHGHMVAKRVRDSLPLKLSAQWEVKEKSDEVVREVSSSLLSAAADEEAAARSPSPSPSIGDDDVEESTGKKFHHTLKKAFLKAFKVMDRELRMYANIDCFCSGTTAVTLVKQGHDLVIGNVGDSRAVLGIRGEEDNAITAVQLTVDLKPNLPAEEERIRKCKGRVFALEDEPEVARVWLPNNDSPGLAMARAFGDFCLKEFGLISVPEISYRRITDKDEFIVLATDGIWDVLSNKEVVDIVGSCPTRSHAARTLVESAVRGWRSKYPTSKVDDCAVVCLFLDSNISSTFSITKSKDNNNVSSSELDLDDANIGIVTAANKDATEIGLNRCGTVRSGNEEEARDEQRNDEASEEATDDDDDDDDDDAKQMNMEAGKEWSALEGVSRLNTLMALPRFVPGEDDDKAAAREPKSRI